MGISDGRLVKTLYGRPTIDDPAFTPMPTLVYRTGDSRLPAPADGTDRLAFSWIGQGHLGALT
jgi:hypothetical protein